MKQSVKNAAASPLSYNKLVLIWVLIIWYLVYYWWTTRRAVLFYETHNAAVHKLKGLGSLKSLFVVHGFYASLDLSAHISQEEW